MVERKEELGISPRSTLEEVNEIDGEEFSPATTDMFENKTCKFLYYILL